jgi:hypothetical protein
LLRKEKKDCISIFLFAVKYDAIIIKSVLIKRINNDKQNSNRYPVSLRKYSKLFCTLGINNIESTKIKNTNSKKKIEKYVDTLFLYLTLGSFV